MSILQNALFYLIYGIQMRNDLITYEYNLLNFVLVDNLIKQLKLKQIRYVNIGQMHSSKYL